EHWRTVGNRHSVLTGSPRLAVTPVHAILNYCFALVESEALLALVAMGMEPSIGLLHQDRPNRNGMVFDLIEPVRTDVERWLYQWICMEHLRRSDFHETATGNVRLHSQLCSKLSKTSPVWRKLLAPWAERIASLLWGSISYSKTGSRIVQPATR